MSTITSSTPAETVSLIDSPTKDITYVAEGKLGSDESEAVWQIIRIQKTGTEIKVQYADGSRRFNQKWTDRATLTYSN